MRKVPFLLFIASLSCVVPHAARAVPLSDAVAAGDLAKTRQLIEAGADVNAKDQEFHTPLHRAAEVGSVEIVRLLLDHNADHNAVDKDGNTPLHIAAAKGRRKIVALLLTRGATVDAVNNDGHTPLHLAAQEARIGTIEDLLNAGAHPDQQDNEGDTALHVAAETGLRKAVELLLKHQANVDAHNQANLTPLDVAVQGGRTQTVEALLDAGAHTGVWDPDSGDGEPQDLLTAALASGNQELVGLLLKKGAAVLPQHVYGSKGGCAPVPQLAAMIKARPAADKLNISGAALAKAAMCGDKQLLTSLMRVSGTVDYAGAATSWASLMVPGKAQGTELFDVLFAKDPQLKAHATVMFDSYARVQFYAAAAGQQNADDSFLTFLLAKGADPNTKDETGNTLLHFAAAEGNLRMVKFLLEHRANPNAATEWGNTPLFRAVLANNVPVVASLLEHGAKVNAANEPGNTPLHFAAARNLKEISELLIQKGANVNAVNQEGNTPLHQAVRFPADFATAGLLLRHGAKVKARNALGYTPLHCAADRNRQADPGAESVAYLYCIQHPCEGTPKDADLVKLMKDLVQHKADVRATDGTDRTPLDLARANTAHPGVVAYLEAQMKQGAK